MPCTLRTATSLQRNAVSVPPKNSSSEQKQVELWKRYIQWEKENPLQTGNVALLCKRG